MCLHICKLALFYFMLYNAIMVRKPRHIIESQREAFNAAQKEKAVFSRRAISHIALHNLEDIPPIAVDHPSKVLRLWLETFPDIASKSLGEYATRVTLHVDEPGEDPLTVIFDRTE